jgi:hypothetical protein
VSLPRNKGECHQKQNDKDKKQQPRFFTRTKRKKNPIEYAREVGCSRTREREHIAHCIYPLPTIRAANVQITKTQHPVRRDFFFAFVVLNIPYIYVCVYLRITTFSASFRGSPSVMPTSHDEGACLSDRLFPPIFSLPFCLLPHSQALAGSSSSSFEWFLVVSPFCCCLCVRE